MFNYNNNFSFLCRQTAFALLACLLYSSCNPSQHAVSKNTDGYQSIFDGKTLNGWEFDSLYWRVEHGNMVGEITADKLLKRNSFIIKKDLVVKDFELKVEYRISAKGNSGINYRSQKIDSLPYAMRGYQADINGANNYTGQNYEERGRTTLAYQGQQVTIDPLANSSAPLKENISSNAWTKRTVTASAGNTDTLRAAIKKEDWNECHIIARGNRLLHYVNNILMSDVTDNDTLNRKIEGSIGVQVHVGPPMKIEYRNFRVKKL
jgi:hypothetical protein